MPFLIRQMAKFDKPKSNKTNKPLYSYSYSVSNAETGDVKAYGTSKEKAIRQIELLSALYKFKKNKKAFWI